MAITPTARLGLNKQGMGDPNWDVALDDGFDNADANLIIVESVDQVGIDNPNGAVAGTYIGQPYWADEVGVEYRCRVTGAIGTALWSRISNDMVSLGDYATTGDTAAAIKTALQDAVTDAVAFGLKGVYIPAGTWISNGNVAVVDGTRLYGAGKSFSVIQNAQAAPQFLAGVAVNDVAWEDLTLNGNSLGTVGIFLVSGVGMSFKNLLISNMVGNGITVSNAITATQPDDILIENVTIRDCTNGGLILADTSSPMAVIRIANLLIDNCMQTASARGCRIRGTVQIDGLKIWDDNIGVSGVGLELVADTVNNSDPDLQNGARFCNVNGLEIQGLADLLIAARINGYGNTVDGGYISIPGQGVESLGDVAGADAEYIQFSNIVVRGGTVGLSHSLRTSNCIIHDCVAIDCDDAIILRGTNNIAQNNKITDGTRGITIVSGAVDCQVISNSVSGLSLANRIIDDGTDSNTWRGGEFGEQTGNTVGTEIDLEPGANVRVFGNNTGPYLTMTGKQPGRRVVLRNDTAGQIILNTPDNLSPGELRLGEGLGTPLAIGILIAGQVEVMWDGTSWLYLGGIFELY